MDENIKPLSDIPAINRFLSYCRIRTVPSKTVVIHAGDLRSRAIVEAMRTDEIAHGARAKAAGAVELPAAARALMRRTAQVMTSTAYWL